MKTKMQEPDFLKQLNTGAYKTRLETDLANLEQEQEPVLFLLDTEYNFVDKSGIPLFVVGATLAWRDFIKNEVKTKKNPNFASGECQFINNNGKKTLHLELHKGKAKPAAILKAFKKHSVLKTYEFTFVEMESIEEEMEDSLAQLSQVKTKGLHLKKDLYDVIKDKVKIYKEINPVDTEGRNKAIDELLQLIQDWKNKHPKPTGNDAKIAQALQTLDASLRQQAIKTAQTEDAELFYDILEEYNEIKNLDFTNIDEKQKGLAIKECKDVLAAVAKWDNAHEGVNTPAITKQRNRITPILQKTRLFLSTLSNLNPIDKSRLLSPTDFLQQAGLSLKDSGSLASLIKELEDIQEAKDQNGKNLDKQIRDAQSNALDLSSVNIALGLIQGKIDKLNSLQANALKFAKSNKDANLQKAVAGLIKSIGLELAATCKQRTLIQNAQALRETKSVASKSLQDRQKIDLKKDREMIEKGKLLPENKDLDELTILQKGKKKDIIDRYYQAALKENNTQDLSLEDFEKNMSELLKTNIQKELDYEEISHKQALTAEAGNVDAQTIYNESIKGLKSLMAFKRATNGEVKTNMAFVLRGNSIQSATITDTVNELGGNYGTTVLKSLEEIAMKSEESLEINPDKEPDEQKRRANAARIELFYRELVQSFAGSKALNEVPTSLKTYCRDIYQTAIDEGAAPNEAEDLIGGIFFLRYINPMLTQMAVRFSGKKNQSTFMTISKLFQNQANRTIPGDKEASMTVFKQVSAELQKTVSLFIKGLAGTLSETEEDEAEEERHKITNNLYEFAKRNPQQRDEFHDKLTTYDALYNPKLRPALALFCKQEFSTENMDSLLEIYARNHIKNTKAFYETYIADRDALNIPAPIFKAFQDALDLYIQTKNTALKDFSTDNWKEMAKLWAKAFEQMKSALESNMNDTFSRFIINLPNSSALQKALWG